MDSRELEVAGNFITLSKNPYPGRGVVVGRDERDNQVQIVWIMGRHKDSRKRVYAQQDRRIYTAAANPFDVGDSSLIYYNAMREINLSYFRGDTEPCDLLGIPGYGSTTFHFASNGDQTDIVHTHYATNPGPMRSVFRSALQNSTYEPDAACTPRITAVSAWVEGVPRIELSILRKSLLGDTCERDFFERSDIAPGFGYCLTTYLGDGNPPPSFRGEPYLVPLSGNIEEIAGLYWECLNPENRVAVAAKFIPKKGDAIVRIINRY